MRTQHPTTTLEGPILDLAIALTDPKCEGLKFKILDGMVCGLDPQATQEDEQVCIYLCGESFQKKIKMRAKFPYASAYTPSVDYAQGMSMVETMMAEGMSVHCDGPMSFIAQWKQTGTEARGETLLLAAMRARSMRAFGQQFDAATHLRD